MMAWMRWTVAQVMQLRPEAAIIFVEVVGELPPFQIVCVLRPEAAVLGVEVLGVRLYLSMVLFGHTTRNPEVLSDGTKPTGPGAGCFRSAQIFQAVPFVPLGFEIHYFGLQALG